MRSSADNHCPLPNNPPRRRTRCTVATAVMPRPMPTQRDPIWRLGHGVVAIVASYLYDTAKDIA